MSTLGPRTALKDRKISGSLAYILSQTNVKQGTKAAPNDVAGCTLEMGADGLWAGNLGTLTQAQADALVAAGVMGNVKTGTRATVGTSEVSWNGSAWSLSGNVVPTYDTWDLAVAAAGSTLGWEGYVKRLCGNGYFHVMHNGVRLGVGCGESIIRDAGVNSAGYSLTATGTAYIPLISYTIPAGLIGDGEEWEYDQHAMSLDVHASGSDQLYTYIGGQAVRGSVPALTAANQVARARCGFVRLGNLIANRAGGINSDLYSAATNGDTSVDLAASQVLTAGFIPGAATNKMRMRHFCLRRIG